MVSVAIATQPTTLQQCSGLDQLHGRCGFLVFKVSKTSTDKQLAARQQAAKITVAEKLSSPLSWCASLLRAALPQGLRNHLRCPFVLHAIDIERNRLPSLRPIITVGLELC